MTKRKQKQNELVSSNMETDSRTSVRTSSSAKAEHLPTGVWKFFKKDVSKANSCKRVPEEWYHHFNYIIVNNLEDVPTDKPLYGMSNTVSPLVKRKKTAKQPDITNWYDSMKIEQLIIDEAIQPFFINALNLLNAGYEVPSYEVLSECLLDTKITKIINKVDKILDHTNNLTIEEIQENYSKIVGSTILTILHGRGIGLKFGTFPLITNYARKLWQQMGKSEKSCETLITHLRFYKEQEQYINGKPNPYAAPYRIEQLRHIHTIEVSPEIIANIAESVFKELEVETLLEDDVELSNPKQSFKDLDRDESDNNDMQDNGESEYNIDEMVARQLDYDLD
ncbi:18097_t:CDS:2, partial [Gigaspora margarita]